MILVEDFVTEEFDYIDAMLESPIYDEYRNYRRILSESVMLSEAQEIKLSILREFSFQDIKNKLIMAFEKIKQFFINLINKIKYFFKRIGKDEKIKKAARILSKMSPAERKRVVRYGVYDLESITNSLDERKLEDLRKLGRALITAPPEKIKELVNGRTPQDFKIMGNKADEDKKFTMISGQNTIERAFNDISKMSTQIDKFAKKIEKLSKSLAKEADSFKNISKSLGKKDKDGDAQETTAAAALKNVVIPAFKGNSKLLKYNSKQMIAANKAMLKGLVEICKGQVQDPDSAMGIDDFDAGAQEFRTKNGDFDADSAFSVKATATEESYNYFGESFDDFDLF